MPLAVKEYYVTHQMFLTPRSLFLLVLDLSLYDPEADPGAQSSFESLVLQWVHALQARVPGMVMRVVATHTSGLEQRVIDARCKDILEKLMADEQLQVTKLEEWLRDLDDKAISNAEDASPTIRDGDGSGWNAVRAKFVRGGTAEDRSEWQGRLRRQRAQRPSLPNEVICVDSKAYVGFEQLHVGLNEALGHFADLGSMFPTSYLKLGQAVETHRNKTPITTYGDFMEMARRDCSEDSRWVLDGEALLYALRFLSASGTVLYYEENKLMAGHVFMDVQWLADACKRIIRDWTNEAAEVQLHQGQDGMDSTLFQQLKGLLINDGVLEERLLVNLWLPILKPLEQGTSTSRGTELNLFGKALAAAMMEFGLLVPLAGKQPAYLVPWNLPEWDVVKSKYEEDLDELWPKETPGTSAALHLMHCILTRASDCRRHGTRPALCDLGRAIRASWADSTHHRTSSRCSTGPDRVAFRHRWGCAAHGRPDRDHRLPTQC